VKITPHTRLARPLIIPRPRLHRADKPYPYFAFPYTFAYVYETNEKFRDMWNRCADLSADPAHALQFALAKNAKLSNAELDEFIDSYGVHKLNWRAEMHPAVRRALFEDGSQRATAIVRKVNRLWDDAVWLASRVVKKAAKIVGS